MTMLSAKYHWAYKVATMIKVSRLLNDSIFNLETTSLKIPRRIGAKEEEAF